MGFYERSTIIVGNGLGMSIDKDFYRLDRALASAWNGNTLSPDDKNLIQSIYGNQFGKIPASEEEFSALQKAISAIQHLQQFSAFMDGESGFLTKKAHNLPGSIRRFIYDVACEFISNRSVPNDFRDALAGFIKKSNSHLVTLNYDNLLYDAMKQRDDVFCGYEKLFDGYKHGHLTEKNLNRHENHPNCWYLHLHGSPLFRGEIKATGWERGCLDPISDHHLVLTHFSYKQQIIDSSYVLRLYWSAFSQALRESKKVFLVGYSGQDIHLNDLINSHFSDGDIGLRVFIVEWEGAGQRFEREQYWNSIFPTIKNLFYEPVQSIKDFTGWKFC